MTIKLNEQEAQNAKACILMAVKQPSVGENEMAALLMLARKFTVVENPPQGSGKPPIEAGNVEPIKE